MPDIFSPNRKKLAHQFRVAARLLEGPGELDSMVADASGMLLQIMLLMRGANERALEEREAAGREWTRRQSARAAIPAIMARRRKEREREELVAYLKAHPEEAQRWVEDAR